MEIVSFPWAIQRRHKEAFSQLPLCTQLTIFLQAKTSMKNQPLQGGEANFFKALDATKATGCGFQIMVTDHCRDAGGWKGSNLLGGTQFSFYPRREQKAELYRGTACQHLAAKKISAAVRISAHRSSMASIWEKPHLYLPVIQMWSTVEAAS